MKMQSQNRYRSPRQMSGNGNKLNRRSRVLTRHRISKSLNFETGRNDRFKTPSSAGLEQLSRSAKIMRALNFNSCPTGNNTKRKSVTKVLNFDMSPNANIQSPASNFSTSSPFDNFHLSISSSDSQATSIDENQNRTPSHSRKSAKKSLNYMTPQSNSSLASPKVNISPVLRSELRNKISNLIEIGDTPNVHSSMRHGNNSAVSNDIMNTSRNLYYDFQRECSDASPCPSTPENTSQPVPESTSAIKKSHRKERLCKRFEEKEPMGKLLDYNDDHEGMHLLEPEDQTTSPDISQHTTPNNRTNQSLDISNDSDPDDSISETGSLFSYSRNKENIEELEELIVSDLCSTEKELETAEEMIVRSPAKANQDHLETPKRDKSTLKDPCFYNECTNAYSPKKLITASCNVAVMPPNSTPLVPRKNINAHTPENDISAIPDIMGSSIKKSHKKVKEENRKRFLKPTVLHAALLNSSRDLRNRMDNDQLNSSDRPTTPENLNSSRMLLPMFHSVERSHKKEKHRKKLQGYARRSMLLDVDHLLTSSQSNLSNVSVSLKVLLDKSTNSEVDDERVEKKDLSEEIKPIDQSEETASSPSKKMKTPEGEAVMEQSKEISDEFQIFTPLRKRRSQLIPVEESVGAYCLDNEVNDDRFITPVKGINVLPLKAVEDVTPEDRLCTSELVKDIEHSIKKSHRKDKLAARQKLNRLNRSLNITFNESLKHKETNDPQPSASNTSNDDTSLVTPPNHLKSKIHMQLQQNSSIKQIYKVEKEKRRSVTEVNRSIDEQMQLGKKDRTGYTDDSNLSDDGSIFSEEDRLSFLEAEGAIEVNQEKEQKEMEKINKNSLNKSLNHSQGSGSQCPDVDQSFEESALNNSRKLQVLLKKIELEK